MKQVNLFDLGRWGLLLVLWGISSLAAQVSVVSGSPYSQYVTGLETEGVEISNVVINCDTFGQGNNSPQMGGFFSNGSSVGIDSGLLITSGSIDFALTTTGGVGVGIGTPGDADLSNLVGGGTTNDACIVNFDFTARCDSVTFEFVFGSNEYPSFVGSFDDVAAIFITGPGFTPNQNVALVPVVNIPLSISNINSTTNSAYHNATPTGVGYNEHSVVLRAVLEVQPCQTYSVKMAVADEGDAAYDTGLFISPFECNQILPSVIARNVVNTTSDSAVENCADGYFTFFPEGGCSVGGGGGPVTGDVVIYFSLTGSATDGTDYNIGVDSVLIPAGADSINLPALVVDDMIPEGLEAIVLNITDPQGNVLEDSTAVLYIKDAFDFQADAGPDIDVCSGVTASIGPITLPPMGTTYNWDSNIGFLGPSNTFNPNVAFNTVTTQIFQYSAEVVDPNGCIDRDTVQVTFLAEPLANFSILDNEICLDEQATITYAITPQPGYVYNWDFGDNVATVVGSGPGPYQVDYLTAGPKIIRLVVNDGDCASDTISQVLTVNPIPTSTFILDDTVCVDEFTQLIYAGSGSVGATFDWQVPAGTPSTLTGIGPHNVSWPTSGFQQVSLTVEENGCVSPTTINTTLAVPIPENSFIILDSICVGESVTVSYSGSAPPTSDFSWNFGDATVLSGTGVGPYELVWNTPGARNVCLQVGIGGCNSLVNCQTVEVLDRPVALIDPVADQCFPGNSFDFTYTILGGAADVYQWNFGPSAVPPVFTGPTPPTVTYQSIGPKTVELLVFSNGCQAADTAKVSFEVKEPPTADFTYSSGSVCADTCVTFNYAGVDNGQIFVWDFGSGAIPAASSVANPGCIQYTSGGIKTVTLTVIDGPCTITTTQQVSVNNGPAVNAGLPKEFCEGDGGVELDGTVTGGEMPYFYEWWCDRSPNCGIDSVNVEDPRVNPDVTNPTEEVVYYFQVTDVNGCRSNIDSVVVTVKAKPVLNAGPDLSICAPNAPGAFLQGSEADNNNAPLPITYAWSPSTGLNDSTLLNPFARPESTTIYTLTGTSVNGCSSVATTLDTTSSMTLTVLPKPRAIVSADTGLCVGESLELEGFAEGAGPDYTYTWTASPTGSLDDPNSSTPIVTPTQATTYTLVVTSNGCDSDGDTVRVEVDTKPTIDPGTNFSACKFEEVLLDARASGDPRADSYSYQWSPAAGLSNDTLADPIATPDESTIYTVFAVSEFGCSSDTAEVELTLKPTPEVDLLAQDTSICGEFEMTLTAVHSFTTESSDQVNYQWFPEDFAYTNIFDSVVTVVPTRTGYLTVEAIVSSGDCPTRDSIFVAVAPALEAIASADTSRICAGQTIGIYAEGGNGSAIFEWAPATGLSATNGTELQANPDTTTEYILTVTEGICVTRDTLRLEVNPTPEADYFTSITTGCGDLEVSFFSNSPGAIAYVWDFGDGTEITNEVDPVHFYEAPGTYTVTHTAIGIGGCESVISRTPIEVGETTASDFVSVPTSDEELPVGTAVIFEEQATGEVSYLWDFGDGGMERIANPTHTFERPGDYIVTLITTDSLGCTSTASYGPYVIIVPDLVLQNVFSPNGDGINDEFQIPYPGDEAYTLVIYDRWGREVFSADSPTDVWNGNLASGSPAREGVYRYTLRIGDQTYNSTITLLR